MTKMLRNLKTFIEDAEKYAEERGFPVENLLGARLAPDMFPLTRQIQGACDAAKFTAARCTGTDAPVYADDETSLEELRGRIDKTIAFMESVDASSYSGASERMIELPFMKGRPVPASEYFVQFAQPNFYFHLMTAYTILRHNGVPLGKNMYIGNLDV